MAQQTALSPLALPGQIYSFGPKTPAIGGKGAGPFTTLSPLGISGLRYAFLAKGLSPGAKGVGPFTELSLLALPGRRHAFSPKIETEVTVGGAFRPIIRPRRRR